MAIIIYLRNVTADFHTVAELLMEAGYKQKTLNDYSYFIDHRETTAQLGLDKTITFNVNEHHSLQGLEIVRHTILDTKKKAGGILEEENYHIGYLADESKVRLFHNWESWLSFLYRARYQTMQGQQVRVYTPAYQLLDEGILLEYTAADDRAGVSRVVSCSIKKETEESVVKGEPYLIIEATGELFILPEE